MYKTVVMDYFHGSDIHNRMQRIRVKNIDYLGSADNV
jgi:hypothetical protein